MGWNAVDLSTARRAMPSCAAECGPDRIDNTEIQRNASERKKKNQKKKNIHI